MLKPKGDSAAKGAAGGAAAGLGTSLMMGDPMLAAIMLPVMVPVGLLVGVLGGAASGSSDAAIQDSVQAWEKVSASAQLQQRLRDRVVAELQGESAARTILVRDDVGPTTPEERPRYENIGADVALEVSMLEIRFLPQHRESDQIAYSLAIAVRARAIDTGTQAVLDEMRHVAHSKAHTATDWLKDDATLFTSEVNEALRESAEAIVLELFRLYYPPADLETPRGPLLSIPYYAIQHVYPPPPRWTPNTELTGNSPPLFQWEAFPRPIDIQGVDGKAARFSDVTYDIAIYSVQVYKAPASVVLRCSLSRGLDCPAKPTYTLGPRIYLRKDLSATEHRLDMLLEPCGQYAWSVRSRFRLDGHARATEWSGTYLLRPPWQVRRALLTPDRETLESDKSPILFRAPPASPAQLCDG